MSVFPSLEWCQAVVAAIHADPQSAVAGKGWKGDLAAVALPEGPLREPFLVYARSAEGRVLELRELEDLDEVDEIEPAYFAKAGYQTWKKLIAGELDPIEALMQRRIELRGDLQPIIERAQFKDLFWRVLARVPTTFIDEP
jgi:putative sterol carrier protein